MRRGLANLTCRMAQSLLPRPLQPWGWALRLEADAIADDTEAALFALSGAFGLTGAMCMFHLRRVVAALRSGDMMMRLMDRPRLFGIGCAIGAVMLGLAYLAAAGAPLAYQAVNAASFVLGLVAIILCSLLAPRGTWPGALTVAMALALLATALFGEAADGTARWVRVGPIALQPSLILLPAMIVAFARSRDALATLGLCIAALALALQPDRAMAAVLFAAVTALAILRLDRHVMTAFVAATAGLAVTLVRADTPPAVPFVDQILYSAFDIHLAAGFAVTIGSALLIVPALMGALRDCPRLEIYAAFGAVWLVVVAAAALGNYPTPVVGYGGSAVLGYLLSLALLPTRVASASSTTSVQGDDQASDLAGDRRLRSGLALPA